jgi:hypothetical protein
MNPAVIALFSRLGLCSRGGPGLRSVRSATVGVARGSGVEGEGCRAGGVRGAGREGMPTQNGRGVVRAGGEGMPARSGKSVVSAGREGCRHRAASGNEKPP